MRKPYTRYDEYTCHLLMEEERQREALKAFDRRERKMPHPGWRFFLWLCLSVILALFGTFWIADKIVGYLCGGAC